MDRPRPLHWPVWLPWLVTVCVILAFYRLSHDILIELAEAFRPVLVPLLLSLSLAYLLQPLVTWLQSKSKLGHELVICIALGVGGVILAIILVFLVPPVIAQLFESIQRIPEAVRTVWEWLQPYLEYLRARYPSSFQMIERRVTESFQDGPGDSSILSQALSQAAHQIVGITANVLNFILIPIFTFYTLRDLGRLRTSIERLVPPRFRSRASRLLDRTGPVISSFVRGQLTIAIILSWLYSLGYWSVGVPLALSLGFLTGFGYLIPYIGAFVAVIITILLTMLNQPGWWPVVGVVAIYLGVHALEGFYLTPRILGNRLQLHPMVVIVGLILAGSLFGVLGIVLALPVLALLKVWLEVLMESYLQSLTAQEQTTPPPASEHPSLSDS